MKNHSIMQEFLANNNKLIDLVTRWEPRLLALQEELLTTVRNRQNRTIKQILGHMVDSASNNTHRIIHLQYQPSPLIFPDYANLGNNDKWITIQNYQSENWHNLVKLWKYANMHLVHVINKVNMDKIDNEWITALGEKVSLRSMITGYLPHFKLHLSEIDELLNYDRS